MRFAVEQFAPNPLDGIDRRDLVKFSAFLDEKEQAPRSVYNKFESLMTFLKANVKCALFRN